MRYGNRAAISIVVNMYSMRRQLFSRADARMRSRLSVASISKRVS